MRVTKKRIPARMEVSYQCETCGTKYGSKSQAKKCEERILEFNKFRVGETVRNITPRQCHNGKNYFLDGIVIKIYGPVRSDSEFELLHLGGKKDRIKGHVYQYEVKYVCPVCNQLKTALYYTPEIKSLEIVKRHQTR